jgi:transmembrane sensor
LVTLVAGGAWWQFERHFGEVYSSVAGEIRSIALSDGSHLTLDAGSIATVHFEETSREILLDRGEAYVAVARDPSRPFVVRTKDAEIRALGTAFAVRIFDGKTNILVSEGVVEILRPGQAAGQGQRISAQQSATVSSNAATPEVEAVARDVLERKLAWQEGKASFAGEPLSAAVAEINRHSRLQVLVDDTALASKRVIGVFNASDAEVFANAVAAAFNAQVVRENDGLHLKPETGPRSEE